MKRSPLELGRGVAHCVERGRGVPGVVERGLTLGAEGQGGVQVDREQLLGLVQGAGRKKRTFLERTDYYFGNS